MSDWQLMDTAPKDGTRIRLLHCGEVEYHGWWEENFECFMGMDSEWNLLKLGPTGWLPLDNPRRG